MYNKKVLQTAVKELDKAKAPAKRKDIITDPMGQWKYPGQVTRIPSDTITMQGVNYPVYGVPDYGQPVLMQPGQDYDFPGANYVDEYPQMRRGGGLKSKKYTRNIEGTNRFFAESALFKKPKKLSKKRIFDPNAKYFQTGGAKTPEEWGAEIRAIEQQIGSPDQWSLEGYSLLQNKLDEYRDWRENTPEGQAVMDSHNVEGEYDVPVPEHLQDYTNAMMKSRLAYANEFGNPAAKRMVNIPDNPYQFEDGNTGTHYMSSMDNYAVPQIQEEDGQLVYGDYDPESNEAIRFENDADAQYFARNYKKVSPGFIEAELTPEQIEEYAKGGFIIEDISVPQLTQAQKGITISDPKEYAYRKAAYDDSMYLYKNNLEPLPKIGPKRLTSKAGDPSLLMPYRTSKSTNSFKGYLQSNGFIYSGNKYNGTKYYLAPEIINSQISSPAYEKYLGSDKFTKHIPANKPIKVDKRTDYYHPQSISNPFTGKATGFFYPGQNEQNDADTHKYERARFKKPVQPVYFKKEGDKKSVQKSYNKVGNYNKNTNPNGWVSPPKKDQPYEKSRSTINKIPTVDPMGKRRIGETSNATIDPTTGNVTEVITPNYENLLPLKRLETERRNQIIESKVQQRKQSDYKTAYRDQTIVSYDPTIKQFIQTGSRKAPLPYSEKIGTKDWELNTSQEIPESGPLVFQVDGKDYYNEEEAKKAQAFMPQGSYNFAVGGEADDYMDLDLTEDEIQQYAMGGFIIEELPEAQVGGGKYDPLVYSKPQVSESTRPNLVPKVDKKIIDKAIKQKTVERKIVTDKIKKDPLLTKKQKTEILMSPKKQDEYAYLAYEKDLDTVKEIVPQSNSDRAWEYITNPFTAAEYAISGGGAENMPYNINEMRMAGIDPGVVQGRNLVGNALNMSTNLFDASDKVVRNVGEGNYGDATLEALRFLPGSRLSTGLGKQLGIKSGLLSKVNKVNLDGLNDYEKLSSQLPGSPNNLKIINAPGVPKKPTLSPSLITEIYPKILQQSGNDVLTARARLADLFGRDALQFVDEIPGAIPENLLRDPLTRGPVTRYTDMQPRGRDFERDMSEVLNEAESNIYELPNLDYTTFINKGASQENINPLKLEGLLNNPEFRNRYETIRSRQQTAAQPAYLRRGIRDFSNRDLESSVYTWGEQNINIPPRPQIRYNFDEIIPEINYVDFNNVRRNLARGLKPKSSFSKTIGNSIIGLKNTVANTLASIDNGIGQIIDKSKIQSLTQPIKPADIEDDVNKLLESGLGIKKGDVKIKVVTKPGGEVQVLLNTYDHFKKNKKLIEDTYGEGTFETWMQGMDKDSWIDSGKLSLSSTLGEEVSPRKFSEILSGKKLEPSTKFGIGSDLTIPAPGLKRSGDFPFKNWDTQFREKILDNLGISGEISQAYKKAAQNKGNQIYSGGTGHLPAGAKRYVRELLNGRVEIMNNEASKNLYELLDNQSIMSDVNKALKDKNTQLPEIVLRAVQPLVFKYKRKGGAMDSEILEKELTLEEIKNYIDNGYIIEDIE